MAWTDNETLYEICGHRNFGTFYCKSHQRQLGPKPLCKWVSASVEFVSGGDLLYILGVQAW